MSYVGPGHTYSPPALSGANTTGALASAALDSARVYLNDIGKSIWTDNTLLSYLGEAYGDMILALWLNGMPVIKELTSTPIPVPTGEVSLTLPTDLVEPISMSERAQGSIDDWIPMTEREFEPNTNQETTLRYWVWREETIAFIGATTDREVQLRYWKALTKPTATDDRLGFIFAEYFLGPQTAGYAAGSVGNFTLASELLYRNQESIGLAGSKLDMIIRANIKGQQGLPVRRIPYRRRLRHSHFGG